MIEFNYTPTPEQLQDRNFWESLPPEGALFDGYLYTPLFDVLINNELVKFVGDDNSISASPYEYAVQQVERLSKEHDNVSLKVGGFCRAL